VGFDVDFDLRRFVFDKPRYYFLELIHIHMKDDIVFDI